MYHDSCCWWQNVCAERPVMLLMVYVAVQGGEVVLPIVSAVYTKTSQRTKQIENVGYLIPAGERMRT